MCSLLVLVAKKNIEETDAVLHSKKGCAINSSYTINFIHKYDLLIKPQGFKIVRLSCKKTKN